MSNLFTWNNIIDTFKQQYGDDIAELLFYDSYIKSIDGDVIYIKVDKLSYGILKDKNSKNYLAISEIISNHFSTEFKVEFSTEEELVQKETNINTKPVENYEKVGVHKTNLISNLTFDNYFYSYDNRNMIEACKQVISEITNDINPLSFNPFFIYGSSGIGKTHIANAVGNELMNVKPDLKILYKNATEFFNEYSSLFKGSLNTEQLDNFKDLYFNLDVFIIDDIQMLQTKEGTLNEFFSIFENLRLQNKTIIITSDVNPKYLAFEERLLTRFLSGLVMEMQFPDSDTKTQIFKYHSQQINLNIEESAIKIFIESSKNVRELLGYINSIKLDLITNSDDDSVYTKQNALENVNKATGKHINLTKDDIINIVCDYFDVTKEELKMRSRKQVYVIPRNFCVYFYKVKLNMTYVMIAKEFNMKDHTNAVKIVKDFDNFKSKNIKDYEFLAHRINNKKK